MLSWIKRLNPLRQRNRERDIKPLERALLCELRSRLDTEAAQILGEQIACIDRVWWSQDTFTSVLYYVPMAPGQSSPTFRRFPADYGDLTLASGHSECPGANAIWSVNFEIAHGFIGGLRFDPDPAPILDSENPTFREFRIHVDHMLARRKRPQACEKPCPDVSDLHGWIKECVDLFGATGLQWPLEEALFREKYEGSSRSFPDDYLDVVTQTDGITLGQMVRISGIGDAYEVKMDDGTYLLLAEFAPYDASGYLGVKVGDGSCTVYRLGTEKPSPVPLGVSFRDAVTAYLRQNAK